MLEGSAEQRRSAYLANAQRARLLADAAIDPQARQSFRHVADGWEDLARRLALAPLSPLLRQEKPENQPRRQS